MRELFLICCLSLAWSDQIRHDGHKAIRIVADTDKKAEVLHHIGEDVELDVWREVRGQLDVMVSPDRLLQLEQQLEEAGLSWTTLVEDVQQLIDLVELPKTPRAVYNYSDFNRYETIQQEIRVLAEDCVNHPVFDDVRCVVDTMSPDTLYGRPIEILRVRRPGADRKVIYMDSLIHAREWLAGTTLMSIANDIVHGLTQDGIDTLEKYDFYFNPVVNPDGYIYSWDEDRTWRKNRNPNFGSNCTGVDLNRNFEYDWGVEPGSSDDECSSTYRGSSAASERETQVVQMDMMSHGRNILLYMDIHTSGNMWLTSYGAELSPGVCKLPDDYFECVRTAAQFAAMGSASVYGTTWTYGNICETIYPATGGTIDYITANEDVTFAFGPELRGTDNDGNDYGFYAPASEIPYAYSETWMGVLSAIVQIEQLVAFGTCST